MNKYTEDARRQAEEYEKKRREAADAVIRGAEITYTAAREVAEAQTAAAERDENRAMIDEWDTAAVERELTRRQVRESMASFGLSGSGSEAARLQGADTAADRRVTGAKRTRDEAVSALREALRQTEITLAARRDTAIAEEEADAAEDVGREWNDLTQSAYTAASREESARVEAAAKVEVAQVESAAKVEVAHAEAEAKKAAAVTAAEAATEAARIAAAAKVEAERIKADESAAKRLQEAAEAEAERLAEEQERQEKAAAEAQEAAEKAAEAEKKAQETQKKQEQEAQQKAAQTAEKNRQTGLKKLCDDEQITTELYATALEKGWTVEYTLQVQQRNARIHEAAGQAKSRVMNGKVSDAYLYLEQLDLPDDELQEVCDQAGLNYGDARTWILTYRSMEQSTPALKQLKGATT